MRDKRDLNDDKKFVSKLIFNVLTKKLCVRKALLSFPKDVHDESIEVAYHALCHFEADEDIRKRDNLYALEQDDYLELIANILAAGDGLPPNIINSYSPFYKEAATLHEADWKGIWAKLTRFLNI